jgi:FKBP-type peptidyl-prolyl cis-trans isomerase
MMKSLLAIFFSTLVLISCKKNNSGCSPVPPASEAAQMTAFCQAKGITYTVDSNGIYYQIIDQGAGSTPNMNSTVTVTYTTSTLVGTLVEDKSSTPVTLPLSQFIEGWRLAIPYLQKGGHIKMIIPSSLAYGCVGNSSGSIPPNTPLYTDLVLVNVE